MRLFYSYLIFYFRQLYRQPSYVLSTLVFPSLFFLFFAQPNITSEEAAEMMLGSFAAFAVIGVVIFQFGAEVAHERGSGWWVYQQSLPASQSLKWLARASVAVAFALAAAALVAFTVHLSTDASLTANQLVYLFLALLVGVFPFCFIGLLIGYTFSGRAALPAANLIYIVCSFLGGLWIPPEGLSENIAKVSRYFPTRHYGELVWAAVKSQWPSQFYINALIIDTTIAILAFAFWVRRQNSGQSAISLNL